MSARDPTQRVERRHEEDDEDEGLDFEQIRERIGFALRAPRRRPRLAAGVFVTAAALGLTVAATIPRTYSAQAKLLAQRSLVLPALTNPNRPVPRDADNPTKNVADMIMRRDNLTTLARELDLGERFYASRGPAQRLKDAILGGPANADERLHAVVGTLEKRLYVEADESTVTIVVDWAEPQMAYDIVTHVQQNFLEARYDDQVAMITDAIAVLQEHAKTELAQLNTALDEYQKLLEEHPPKSVNGQPAPVLRPVRGGGGGGGPRPSASASASVDPELAAALEEKRRQIRALEEERQRELDALRQQLTQAQLTLTPQHPTVQALEQQIEARSRPPPELAQLRNEERALLAQMAPPATSAGGGAGIPAPPRPGGAAEGAGVPPMPPIPPLPDWDSDGRAQLARSKLDAAIKSYQDVSARIDTANIELDIARTAFKYRYTVVTPAEVPKKPKKPIATMLAVGSVLGAALLAILFAAGADAWRGRILEPWQVRRRLKVDVLGEFDT